MSFEPRSRVKRVQAISQKRKVFRQKNPSLTVLQWGVDHMMHELSSVAEQPLIMATDFKASSKVSIHNQYYNDQHLPSRFKVKEYCPLVFRDLRLRFGLDTDDFLDSICEGTMIEFHTSSKHSPFYFSHDHRLLIKPISREQVQQFHTTFPQYHKYIVETGTGTRLPRYYGMYRISIGDKEKDHYFLVMHNVRSCGLRTHRVYDLKGSSHDRNASEKELERQVPTLKDNDFKSIQKTIPLHEERASFLEQLEQDILFLVAQKLMDYTLLVCIHEFEGDPPEVDRELDCYHVGAWHPGQKQLFFIGIVDALTPYKIKKKAAHAVRTAAHAGKGDQLSTVNPESYGRRLLDFVASIVE